MAHGPQKSARGCLTRKWPIPSLLERRRCLRRACLSAFVLFLALSLLPSLPPSSAGATLPSALGPSDQPPPLEWGYNIRVTRNGAADSYPQVVGLSDAAGLTWESARFPSGTYYVKLNSLAEMLSQESFLWSKLQSRDGTGRPLGPRAVNSSSGFDVVGDDGAYNVGWARFDEQANFLAGYELGANDSAWSRSPAVARGADGRLVVVRADCDPTCWRVLLAVVYANGTQSAAPVDLSSALSSGARFATVVANPNRTRFAVTFGSADGTFIEAVDGEGNRTGGPLLVRAAADHKIVRPVWGDNGTLHLVWNDTAGILYSRVGANFTFEAENVTIAPSGSAGFPAAVVRGDGSLEVWFAETGANGLELRGMSRWGATWNRSSAVYNLSAWAGDSYDPDAAVLPGGMVVVTWTDTRDGNAEVYMAFGSVSPIQLEAQSPLSVALPRGQNRTLEVRATSWLLGSTQNFTVNWTLASGNGANLTIALDNSGAPPVVYGETHAFAAVVTAQPWAAFNESFLVNVTVNSSAGAGVARTLSFNVTAIWPAQERFFLIDAALKFAAAGDATNFTVALSNGGLSRDFVDLHIGPAPRNGWIAAVDPSSAQVPALGAGYVGLVVTIEVPLDGWMSEVACFELRADSQIDPYGNASLSLCVGVQGQGQTIIEPLGGNSTVTAPGETAVFEFDVLNTLNLPPGNETPFNAMAQWIGHGGTGWGWSPLLDIETLMLARDGRQTIHLFIQVPMNALAGAVIRVQVIVFDTRFGTGDTQVFEVTVGEQRGIALRTTGNDSNPSVGRWSFDMQVTNTGNRPENVTLAAADPGGAFDVRITVAGAPISAVSLPAGGAYNFTLWASAPALGLAGPYGTTVTADAGGGLLREQTLSWVLPVRIGFRLETDGPGAGETTGGATVVWRGTFTFDSNAPAVVSFGVVAPWPGSDVRMGFAGAVPVPPSWPGNFTWSASLQPFQNLNLEVAVTLPRHADAGRAALRVSAQQGNTTAALTWPAMVLYSQPMVKGLEVTPLQPADGELVVLSFTVRNGGDLPMENFTVEVWLDGAPLFNETVVQMGPIRERLFYAQVNLTAGNHTFRVVIDGARITPSDDWSNASASLNVSAGAPPPVPRDFLANFLAVALLAAATAAFWVWRVRRGRR